MALHDLKKQAFKILGTEGETVSPEIKRQRKANKAIEQIKKDSKNFYNLDNFNSAATTAGVTTEQFYKYLEKKPGETPEKTYDDEGNATNNEAIMDKIKAIISSPFKASPQRPDKPPRKRPILGLLKGRMQKKGIHIGEEKSYKRKRKLFP